MRLLCLLTLWMAPLAAGEYVVLAGGFQIRADRIERSGQVLRLMTAGGVIELSADDVTRVEAEDWTEPPPAPEAAPEPDRPQTTGELLEEAAERYGVPKEILQGVAAVESGGDPSAVSPKGAVGIMQLMPATAAELRADPRDPEQNVDAGARYLRDLLLRYDGGLHRSFAAYNAGPAAVDKYRGVPPYRETQTYVGKVMKRLRTLSAERPRSRDGTESRTSPPPAN